MNSKFFIYFLVATSFSIAIQCVSAKMIHRTKRDIGNQIIFMISSVYNNFFLFNLDLTNVDVEITTDYAYFDCSETSSDDYENYYSVSDSEELSFNLIDDDEYDSNQDDSEEITFNMIHQTTPSNRNKKITPNLFAMNV